MLKTELDETNTPPETTQDHAELNERDLNEVAGGTLNFTRKAGGAGE